MGLVQVIIDESAPRVIAGEYRWERDNDGVIILPGGTSFPDPATAGEYFVRTDELKVYRRNDANTAWESIVSVPAAHTHPGGEITSQVADAATLDGNPPSAFAAASHQHDHGADLTNVTANQHHNQVHSIDGSDHTGSLPHSSLSGVTATDHHSNANDPTANQKAALDNAPNALTGSNPVADKDYVDSKAEGKGWLQPVLERETSPPPSPATGARYLIDGTGTGAWSGHDGEIAEWTGSAWDFTVPIDATTVTVQDEDQPYTQTAASTPWVWVASGGATAIHGNEKHTPDMLTVGGNRSDANVDTLTGGGNADALHLHGRRDLTRSYFFDDFLGENFENQRIWQVSTSGSGSSISGTQDAIGGQLRLRSGGASGRSSTLDWNGVEKLADDTWVRFRARREDLSDAYTELGLQFASGGQIYFSQDGTGNWFATCNDGSPTSQDTGVASSTSFFELAIHFTESEVKFYIAGTLVATISSNVPTGLCDPYVYQATSAGTANRDTWLDYVEIDGAREVI